MEEHFQCVLMQPVIDSARELGLIEKMKRVEPLVYDEICYLHSLGISGIVAGGFTAFLLGLTNTYNDVDFFCEHLDAVKLLMSMRNRYKIVRSTDAGIILNYRFSKLQVICIVSLQFSNVAYYNELVRVFDIPVCQKGLFLIHPNLVRNNARITCTDETAYVIQHYRKTISYEEPRTKRRLVKYLKRTVSHGSPSTLRSICQGFLRDRDINYVRIRLPAYIRNVCVV